MTALEKVAVASKDTPLRDALLLGFDRQAATVSSEEVVLYKVLKELWLTANPEELEVALSDVCELWVYGDPSGKPSQGSMEHRVSHLRRTLLRFYASWLGDKLEEYFGATKRLATVVNVSVLPVYLAMQAALDDTARASCKSRGAARASANRKSIWIRVLVLVGALVISGVFAVR